MTYNNVSIAGISYEEAPILVKSSMLSNLVNKPDKFLENITGLETLRFWEKKTDDKKLLANLGNKVLEESGINKQEVGVIINASVTRDYIEPSLACAVHHEMGLSTECKNFDLVNACNSVLSAMDLVANMIETNQIKFGLIIAFENSRPVVENTVDLLNAESITPAGFKQNMASMTLGSGAVALALGKTELIKNPHPLQSITTLSATAHHHYCIGYPDRGVISDPAAFMSASVPLITSTWEKACKKTENAIKKVDVITMHEVTNRHAALYCESCKLDPEKVLFVFPTHGNVGPISFLIALYQGIEQNTVKKGSHVGMITVGSGLNCYVANMIW